MRLRAKKTFSISGSKLILQNQEFTASEKDAREYIRLDLAESLEAPVEEGETVELTAFDLTVNSLEEKSVTELRKIAKDKGVKNYSTMTKDDLVQVLSSLPTTEG